LEVDFGIGEAEVKSIIDVDALFNILGLGVGVGRRIFDELLENGIETGSNASNAK
jgi:hypothetical protein